MHLLQNKARLSSELCLNYEAQALVSFVIGDDYCLKIAVKYFVENAPEASQEALKESFDEYNGKV